MRITLFSTLVMLTVLLVAIVAPFVMGGVATDSISLTIPDAALHISGLPQFSFAVDPISPGYQVQFSFGVWTRQANEQQDTAFAPYLHSIFVHQSNTKALLLSRPRGISIIEGADPPPLKEWSIVILPEDLVTHGINPLLEYEIVVLYDSQSVLPARVKYAFGAPPITFFLTGHFYTGHGSMRSMFAPTATYQNADIATWVYSVTINNLWAYQDSRLYNRFGFILKAYNQLTPSEQSGGLIVSLYPFGPYMSSAPVLLTGLLGGPQGLYEPLPSGTSGIVLIISWPSVIDKITFEPGVWTHDGSFEPLSTLNPIIPLYVSESPLVQYLTMPGHSAITSFNNLPPTESPSGNTNTQEYTFPVTITRFNNSPDTDWYQFIISPPHEHRSTYMTFCMEPNLGGFNSQNGWKTTNIRTFSVLGSFQFAPYSTSITFRCVFIIGPFDGSTHIVPVGSDVGQGLWMNGFYGQVKRKSLASWNPLYESAESSVQDPIVISESWFKTKLGPKSYQPNWASGDSVSSLCYGGCDAESTSINWNVRPGTMLWIDPIDRSIATFTAKSLDLSTSASLLSSFSYLISWWNWSSGPVPATTTTPGFDNVIIDNDTKTVKWIVPQSIASVTPAVYISVTLNLTIPFATIPSLHNGDWSFGPNPTSHILPRYLQSNRNGFIAWMKPNSAPSAEQGVPIPFTLPPHFVLTRVTTPTPTYVLSTFPLYGEVFTLDFLPTPFGQPAGFTPVNGPTNQLWELYRSNDLSPISSALFTVSSLVLAMTVPFSVAVTEIPDPKFFDVFPIYSPTTSSHNVNEFRISFAPSGLPIPSTQTTILKLTTNFISSALPKPHPAITTLVPELALSVAGSGQKLSYGEGITGSNKIYFVRLDEVEDPPCSHCPTPNLKSCTIQTNQCTCNDGWGGYNCMTTQNCVEKSEHKCNGDNGYLIPPAAPPQECGTQCHCNGFWVGQYCDICQIDCRNGQRYRRCDRCGCPAGISGQFCECRSVSAALTINGYNDLLINSHLLTTMTTSKPSQPELDLALNLANGITLEVLEAFLEILGLDPGSVQIEIAPISPPGATTPATSALDLTHTRMNLIIKFECAGNNPDLNRDGVVAKWNGANFLNDRIKRLFTFPSNNPEVTKPEVTDTTDTLPTGDDIFVEPSGTVYMGCSLLMTLFIALGVTMSLFY